MYMLYIYIYIYIIYIYYIYIYIYIIYIYMYIYILFTKESTDFGLELSVAYRVSVHCKLKKSEKIHKDFWTTSSRHI